MPERISSSSSNSLRDSTPSVKFFQNSRMEFAPGKRHASPTIAIDSRRVGGCIVGTSGRAAYVCCPTRGSAAPGAAAASPNARASSRTVGYFTRSVSSGENPRCLSLRCTCASRKECPPRSKKLSSSPIVCCPSNSVHTSRTAPSSRDRTSGFVLSKLGRAGVPIKGRRCCSRARRLIGTRAASSCPRAPDSTILRKLEAIR